MKELFSIIIFFVELLISCNIHSNAQIQPNGTIVSLKKTHSELLTAIKHYQIITLGDLATKDNLVIHPKPSLSKQDGLLHYGDTIVVDQILIKKSLKTGHKDIWYKIKYLSKNGWLYVGNTKDINNRDPYENDNWKLLEIIDKKWTVRKMDEQLSVWGEVEIRNKPGLSNSIVTYLIDPQGIHENYQQTVSIIAMTEETETINEIEDHWLKIQYKSYSGWIFGGFATAERGGHKYYTPANIAEQNIGIY